MSFPRKRESSFFASNALDPRVRGDDTFHWYSSDAAKAPFIIAAMPDLAAIRLRNTLALFNEFARGTVAGSAAGDLRGLEKMFAERLRISPSYWSQLKSRERHIGEKLARQFEVLSGKPNGWLDEARATAATAEPEAPEPSSPVNSDERFAVGLFLTAYRMNPLRVKQQLMGMLEGELAKAEASARVARNPTVESSRRISSPPRLTKIK